MSSYLNPTFVPRDPCLYGWKSVDGSWKPVWFEGKQYPDSTEQGKSEVEELNLAMEMKPTKMMMMMPMIVTLIAQNLVQAMMETLMVILTKLITFLLV